MTKYNLLRKDVYNKTQFSKKIDYLRFKKIIYKVNELLCKEVVENVLGIFIPGIGRFIVLGSKKNYYGQNCSQRTGKKIFNTHTFGVMFSVKWTEKFYDKLDLYRFSSHRENIKYQMNNKIMSGDYSYLLSKQYYNTDEK